MKSNLRFLSFMAAAGMTMLSLNACADEGGDAVDSIIGADRGILGLKVVLPPNIGADSMTYEISRVGDIVIRGDAVLEGQEQVGLKIKGLFVGTEYSISVVANSSTTAQECRGLNENWEILPGRVTTVEVPLSCAAQ